MKVMVPALVEIKLVYYPGEEKLVSLDVLKLYRGEDVVPHHPEDVDLNWWLDEGKLTELPEVPREEMEVRAREQTVDQGRPDGHPEPDLDIPIIPEDPEVIAEREGVHKRIQADIQHKNKEAKVAEEVMLEVPPEWNVVPDLIM